MDGECSQPATRLLMCPHQGDRGKMQLTHFRVTEVPTSGNEWRIQLTHYKGVKVPTSDDEGKMARYDQPATRLSKCLHLVMGKLLLLGPHQARS